MKKLLSALLVLVMLLSLPGIGALAASDGLTWSLDKKGTLTISGKGEMPDYSGDTPPWEKYRDDIKAVVIEKGVTHIGAQCFQFCTKLKSVTIPSSVESIGDAAFYRCEKLSAVTLPDALTEIADQTFDHCTALKSIVTDWTEVVSNLCKETLIKSCIVWCSLECLNHNFCSRLRCSKCEWRHCCIDDVSSCLYSFHVCHGSNT